MELKMNKHVNGTITIGFGESDTKDIDFFFSEADDRNNNEGAVYKLLNTILDFYLENVKNDELSSTCRMKLETIFKSIVRSVTPIHDQNDHEERKYNWRVAKMRINSLNADYDYNRFLNGKDKEFINIVITEEYV